MWVGGSGQGQERQRVWIKDHSPLQPLRSCSPIPGSCICSCWTLAPASSFPAPYITVTASSWEILFSPFPPPSILLSSSTARSAMHASGWQRSPLGPSGANMIYQDIILAITKALAFLGGSYPPHALWHYSVSRVIPAKLNSSDPIPLVHLLVLLMCVGTMLSRRETQLPLEQSLAALSACINFYIYTLQFLKSPGPVQKWECEGI